MKTSMIFKSIPLIVLLGGALAFSVLAQPGSGMGGGNSGSPGMNNGGAGMGVGKAADTGGRGGRGMMFNQSNAPGWTLMTPEERTAFQIEMREVKTYDECKTIQEKHYNLMKKRAKEKGVALQAPRQNGCDRLKARGMIK